MEPWNKPFTLKRKFRESGGILILSAVLVGLAFLIGMVMLRRRQAN